MPYRLYCSQGCQSAVHFVSTLHCQASVPTLQRCRMRPGRLHTPSSNPAVDPIRITHKLTMRHPQSTSPGGYSTRMQTAFVSYVNGCSTDMATLGAAGTSVGVQKIRNCCSAVCAAMLSTDAARLSCVPAALNTSRVRPVNEDNAAMGAPPNTGFSGHTGWKRTLPSERLVQHPKSQPLRHRQISTGVSAWAVCNQVLLHAPTHPLANTRTPEQALARNQPPETQAASSQGAAAETQPPAAGHHQTHPCAPQSQQHPDLCMSAAHSWQIQMGPAQMQAAVHRTDHHDGKCRC